MPLDDEKTDPRQAQEITELLKVIQKEAEEAALVRAMRDMLAAQEKTNAFMARFVVCADVLHTTWTYEIGLGRFVIKAGSAFIGMAALTFIAWFFGMTPIQISEEARHWRYGDGVPTAQSCQEFSLSIKSE